MSYISPLCQMAGRFQIYVPPVPQVLLFYYTDLAYWRLSTRGGGDLVSLSAKAWGKPL